MSFIVMDKINKETEKQFARRKEIAKIIWDNYFDFGLLKLKKSDLIDIIGVLQKAYDGQLNDPNYDDRKIKDVLFDQKCELIELLDNDFFANLTKENNANE